jgi:hypothetical protein
MSGQAATGIKRAKAKAGGQPAPISGRIAHAANPPTQNRVLVPQNHQLHILGHLAAAETIKALSRARTIRYSGTTAPGDDLNILIITNEAPGQAPESYFRAEQVHNCVASLENKFPPP